MKIPYVKSNDFNSLLGETDTPIFIEFTSDTCASCKQLEPVLEQLAVEYEGKLRIFKMDTPSNPKWASKWQIMSLPTFILLRSGAIIGKIVGARTDKIKSLLKEKI